MKPTNLARMLLGAALTLGAPTACSSDEEAEGNLADADAAPTLDAEPGPYDGEGIQWPEKSFDQRLAFMKAVVLPTMRELYVAYDARFADMDCTICHGPNPHERDYAMPSGTLPSLPGMPDDPNIAVFMRNTVTPKMIELLNAKPYSMITGTGFGCMACHGR